MSVLRLNGVVFTMIVDWILVNNRVGSLQDPCYFYQSINDTSMTLGHVLKPADSTICDVINPGWTRFTGSDEGLMATRCPSGRECGTDQQAWMQGLIPSYYNGTTEVDICIRGNDDCCDRLNRLQVKNCNGYVVYNLIFIPPCSRYCFNESSQMLVTVSTTSTVITTTSTVITTISNNSVKKGGLSGGEITGIVIGPVIVFVIVAIVFSMYHLQTRRPTVEPEEGFSHRKNE